MEFGNDRNSSAVPPPTSSPGLSFTHITLIQVLPVLTLVVLLFALPIAGAVFLVLRRRRRLNNRDGGGGRVVQMMPSERTPSHSTVRPQAEVGHTSSPLSPQHHINISTKAGKMVESYYSFELELDNEDYDDVVYSPDTGSPEDDIVDVSLYFDRIRTASESYRRYTNIVRTRTPSVHYYEGTCQSQSYEDLSTAGLECDSDGYDDLAEDSYTEPPSQEGTLMEQIKQMDISKTIKLRDLNLSLVIGRGQFGSVHRGVWASMNSGNLNVAVKALRSNISSRDHIKFLQECYIMAQFDHPNIVQLLGVVSEDGSEHNHKYMVLELLGRGDLRVHLRTVLAKDTHLLESNSKQVHCTLLRFTRQIVAGMKYLAAKGFVHRDLAARNIFISDDLVCKIGDFGLACDMASSSSSSKKDKIPIPLRWAAVEVMEETTYSQASDVWSFGVVLFEMWSLGMKPYGEMGSSMIISFVFSGQRLPPPPGCPKPVYQTMMSCWHPRPASRPSFAVLQSIFKRDDVSLTHFLPEEPSLVHPKAHLLGESTEYTSNLYPSLQLAYAVPNSYTMPR